MNNTLEIQRRLGFISTGKAEKLGALAWGFAGWPVFGEWGLDLVQHKYHTASGYEVIT